MRVAADEDEGGADGGGDTKAGSVDGGEGDTRILAELLRVFYLGMPVGGAALARALAPPRLPDSPRGGKMPERGKMARNQKPDRPARVEAAGAELIEALVRCNVLFRMVAPEGKGGGGGGSGSADGDGFVYWSLLQVTMHDGAYSLHQLL